MDNQTCIIEVGKGLPKKKEFEAWLRGKGHEIDRATSKLSFVDGDAIIRNNEARQIFTKLLNEFKKEAA